MVEEKHEGVCVSRKKIKTVEEWDTFRRSCLYRIGESEKCTHHDRHIENCVTDTHCPRVKQDKPKQAAKELWREDSDAGYRAYLDHHDEGFAELINDSEWQREVERSVPGLDVPATLYNARANYWRSERGWINKRRKKFSIDWKRTYDNACRNQRNQEWKGKITSTVEGVKSRRKAELVEQIRAIGKQLAVDGHASPEHVLRVFAEEKGTHHGNMKTLYASGTIEQLEWVLAYLRDIEGKCYGTETAATA